MPASGNDFTTDEDLVQMYRNSHNTAYIGELYVRYTHLVMGVCMKYLKDEAAAEDATMQIFEKLIQELKKHHVQAFKPWLHTVVKNHCMMHFRQETRQQKNELELKKSRAGDVENPFDEHLETEQEKHEVLEQLKSGLGRLKEGQRQCIELFYLQNKSYQEIAGQTGYSINEVKSYIQNGKRNLKLFISGKD
ncbi:MAG: sigma-70 family RNA polymerase sigma factor [Chitinophagales bacterium]